MIQTLERTEKEGRNKNGALLLIFALIVLLLPSVYSQQWSDDFNRADGNPANGWAITGAVSVFNTELLINDPDGGSETATQTNISGVTTGDRLIFTFFYNGTDVAGQSLYIRFDEGATLGVDNQMSDLGTWENHDGVDYYNFSANTNYTIIYDNMDFTADTFNFIVYDVNDTLLKNASSSFRQNVAKLNKTAFLTGSTRHIYLLMDDMCFGTKTECPLVVPEEGNITAKVYIANVSTPSPSDYEGKTSVTRGEDFYTFINWTNVTNGQPFHPTAHGARCNITFEGGHTEEEGNNSNFTLGSAGDFVTYKEEFTQHSIVNVTNDTIHFRGCHLLNAVHPITWTISCEGDTTSDTGIVPASALPLCSVGTAFVQVGGDSCIGESNVNMSLSYSLSQTKRILDFAADREYFLHLNTYDDGEINYTTIGDESQWETVHTHEYYMPGVYDINASCKADNSDYDRDMNFNLTVENAPPQVFIEQVNTSLGFTSLSDGVEIDYADGVWNWEIAIIDVNLASWNVTWYNSTGKIYSIDGTTLPNSFNTPDKLFRRLDNPYSVNVTATDGNNNVTLESIFFNVTDDTDPTLTWIFPLNSNSSIVFTNYSILAINFTGADEGLYSMEWNLSSDSGFSTIIASNRTDGLTPTSFNWDDNVVNLTFNNTGTYYLRGEVCDGHTGEVIDTIPHIKDENREALVYFGDLSIIPKDWHPNFFDTYRKQDRYSFYYEDIVPQDKVRFIVASNDPLVYLPDSEYPAHFVYKGKYWIDFDEIDATNYNVKTEHIENYTYAYEVEIEFSSAKNVFDFNSIGELNCIVDIVSFSYSPPIQELSDVLLCGEKILDESYNFTITGAATQGCNVRVNEYLVGNDSDQCVNVRVAQDYFFGRNKFELELANGTSTTCNIWKEKVNKTFADYMYYLLYILIIALLMLVSWMFRVPMLMLLAGASTVFLSFEFYTVSNMVGVVITALGLVICVCSFSSGSSSKTFSGR